jgi:hypothetical protein
MRKISFVSFALFTFLYATILVAQPSIKEVTTVDYISNRTVNLMDNPNDYTGSPYYNEDFKKGSISANGKTVASNQILRYNVSKEEFEIRDAGNPKGKILKTIVRDEKITIQIENETFEYVSSEENKLRGYFIPLLKSEKTSLYKKITKTYIASQKAASSMASDIAALYKQKEVFYLIDEKGTYTALASSKKGKLKAFDYIKKQVKDYTKQNKLNLNKEKDLIKLVAYTNTL